jgi:uracil-DNA glycosylase family 4
VKRWRAQNAKPTSITITGANPSLDLATQKRASSWWDSLPARTAPTARDGNSRVTARAASLYPALFRAGFANQPASVSRDDGLTLHDLYITASGRCAPPGNKPTPEELDNCQPFLEREIEIIQPMVVVVLGRMAFDRIVRIYSARSLGWKFAHGAVYDLPSSFIFQPLSLLCSYHPSQQNTLTGKLTVNMFDDIWKKAKTLLK